MAEAPQAAPSLLRRLRPWIIGFAVLFLAFGVFGFLAGPPLARSALMNVLTAQLHRTVTLGGIRINPYAMTIRVNDLRVADGDGTEIFGFDELFLDLDISSTVRLAPVVEEVRLVKPRVRVARLSPGRYNISDLLDEWLKPSDTPTPRFSVNNITISGGKVEFDDRPAGRKHEITELNIALPFISNLSYQAQRYTEPAFSCVVNGAPFKLDGKTKPFSEDRESELELTLKGLDVATYLAYSPTPPPFNVTGGKLDADLKIAFRQPHGKDAELSLSGVAALSGLSLAETGGAPLLNLPRLTVPLAKVAPLADSLAFGDIAVEGLEVFVRPARGGGLNWQDVARRLAAKPAPAPDAKSTPEAKPALAAKPEVKTDAKPEAKADKPLVLAVAGLRLENFALRWQDGPAATLKHIGVTDVKAEVAKRRLDIGVAEMNGLAVNVVRLADGSLAGLNALTKAGAATPAQPAPPRKFRKPGTQPKADTGWLVAVGKTTLADLALRLDDRAVRPASNQELVVDKLTLNAFSTAPGSTANLDLLAHVNKKGELKLSGPVGLSPLAAKLKTEINGFELLPLQPYFHNFLNLTVTRGQITLGGVAEVAAKADGSLSGGWRGQATLGNFHSVDKATSADFLSWKSLHVEGVDVALAPRSLKVGEVALTDFYARVIVSPQGRLNLQDVVKKQGEAEQTAPEGQAQSTAPPATPSAAPAPPSSAPSPTEPAMPVRIAKVTLQGGTVSITDHFVKPNYSAKLNKIGGRVSGLSTDANSVADVDLRGAYDGAPVTIAGTVNPLAQSPALDIKTEVRGVELTPMSPYSGKYAGYNIAKGKLSLYLSYKIADRKLAAENRVFLDQLTFGDKVDSPTATKLPVTLAVALLKNRKGEIDINLPIQGSLDDPQFSVGGIVMQVIVNLLVKAVTSPFALLGSLFGGGEELSCVVFEPGRATLTPEGEKRLEALAKAIDDRPALTLEVAGRVDPEKDAEGLRQVDLERQVKARKLARMVRRSQEAAGVDEVRVDEKEYDELLADAYKRAKFPKPRNFIGLTKSLPREEMEKLMLANAPAGEAELRQLADERAKAVAEWLRAKGKVPAERVFLMPPKKPGESGGPKDAPLSRAEFSLK